MNRGVNVFFLNIRETFVLLFKRLGLSTIYSYINEKNISKAIKECNFLICYLDIYKNKNKHVTQIKLTPPVVMCYRTYPQIGKKVAKQKISCPQNSEQSAQQVVLTHPEIFLTFFVTCKRGLEPGLSYSSKSAEPEHLAKLFCLTCY